MATAAILVPAAEGVAVVQPGLACGGDVGRLVELVGQIKDRHSVKEILLEQLRCGMRCDKLKC